MCITHVKCEKLMITMDVPSCIKSQVSFLNITVLFISDKNKWHWFIQKRYQESWSMKNCVRQMRIKIIDMCSIIAYLKCERLMIMIDDREVKYSHSTRSTGVSEGGNHFHVITSYNNWWQILNVYTVYILGKLQISNFIHPWTMQSTTPVLDCQMRPSRK